MQETQYQFLSPDNPNQRTTLIIHPSVGGAGRVANIEVSPATARRLRTQIVNMRGLPDYDSEPIRYEIASEAMIGRPASPDRL